MAMMPISAYPALSDDRSQQQVLHERKSELNGQAQAVEQSGMDEREKRSALGKINRDIAATQQDIREKRNSEEIRKHMDAEDALRRQAGKSDQEKRLLDRTA